MPTTASPEPRVHVTGPVPRRVEEALRESFELVEEAHGADGILALLTTRVDGDYLDAAGPQLRVVANYAVGVDNVDLDAARQRGVVVTNTPNVLTKATAELALALMLSLLRRVAEGDRFVRRRDRWTFSLEFMLGESLDRKTVGIVGPGRIGRETARLVACLGAGVVYGRRDDPLDPLPAAADVVSLHCPLTPATHHLVDADALARMRPDAILVNTARGPIVDEHALVEALRCGAIAGAALDVYEFEPDVSAELLEFENVVLTPHLGSATRATREAMGMLAVEGLRAVLLDGVLPANAVL